MTETGIVLITFTLRRLSWLAACSGHGEHWNDDHLATSPIHFSTFPLGPYLVIYLLTYYTKAIQVQLLPGGGRRRFEFSFFSCRQYLDLRCRRQRRRRPWPRSSVTCPVTSKRDVVERQLRHNLRHRGLDILEWRRHPEARPVFSRQRLPWLATCLVNSWYQVDQLWSQDGYQTSSDGADHPRVYSLYNHVTLHFWKLSWPLISCNIISPQGLYAHPGLRFSFMFFDVYNPSLGSRVFRFSAPRIWDSLPLSHLLLLNAVWRLTFSS